MSKKKLPKLDIFVAFTVTVLRARKKNYFCNQNLMHTKNLNNKHRNDEYFCTLSYAII